MLTARGKQLMLHVDELIKALPEMSAFLEIKKITAEVIDPKLDVNARRDAVEKLRRAIEKVENI